MMRNKAAGGGGGAQGPQGHGAGGAGMHSSGYEDAPPGCWRRKGAGRAEAGRPDSPLTGI